jgi:hypothetical protein
LLADESKADVLINGISQAAAEAARRLALFSVRRDYVNATVPLAPFMALDLGSVISLQTTRLGYGAGKLFTVTGISIDYQRNTLDLTLFG